MKSHLTMLFMTLLIIGRLHAQTPEMATGDSIPVFRMGEIVVVAERLPMITTTSIYEIKAAEMQQRDIHQPAEAMQFIPGLHVYTGAKNEAVFNLRGFGQRQISVFLDGVPVSLPYDGQIDLSQFSGDHFEQIRVSTGNVSPLYGINALGGSVNLISGTGTSTHPFSLRLEAGTNGRTFGSSSYQNRFGKWRIALHTNFSKRDNFKLPGNFKENANEDGDRRDNSAYRNWSGGVKLLYDIDKRHQIGMNVNHIDNRFNIPPNTGTRFVRYWQFPEWNKTVYSLSSRHLFSRNFIVRTVLFHDTYGNILKSYDDATYTTQDMKYAWDSEYDDYSSGAFIYPSLFLWDRGSTNAILAYKKDTHREKFRNNPFDTYEMATYNAGIEQDIQLYRNHAIIIGADVNYLEPVSAEGAELRDPMLLLNGQFAWQHNLKPDLKLHAAVGKKSRFPTLKELYSERLGRTIPNHGLKAEHAVNSELGIEKNFRRTSVKCVVFYNTLRNLIMVRQLGEGTEQLQNTGKALINGIEGSSRLRLQNIALYANYTFLNARNISYGRPNSHLPNRPYHRFNVTGNWNITRQFGSLLEASYVAGQYYEHPDNLTWHTFDNYFLVNMKVTYTPWSGLSGYVRLNNLTDTLYENEFGVPMPGREILTGIRITL